MARLVEAVFLALLPRCDIDYENREVKFFARQTAVSLKCAAIYVQAVHIKCRLIGSRSKFPSHRLAPVRNIVQKNPSASKRPPFKCPNAFSGFQPNFPNNQANVGIIAPHLLKAKINPNSQKTQGTAFGSKATGEQPCSHCIGI